MRRKGFTLIELLIVIAIIAILAAIAIPQFAKYRVRAYNSAAESDIRNARTSWETYFADYQRYPEAISDEASGVIELTGGALTDTFQTSVSVNFTSRNDDKNISYVMVTKHIQGNSLYGADSDRSALYVATDNDYIGQTISETGVNIPTSTRGADDFAGSQDWRQQ